MKTSLAISFFDTEAALTKKRKLSSKPKTVNPSFPLSGELGLLSKAHSDLRSSRGFVRILEAVLAVGNHLNGGTYRGQATGFKLDALLKLMDVKGSDKQTRCVF
jgi:hypothetical protein